MLFRGVKDFGYWKERFFLFFSANTSMYCKYEKVKRVTQNAEFVLPFKNSNATAEIINLETTLQFLCMQYNFLKRPHPA